MAKKRDAKVKRATHGEQRDRQDFAYGLLSKRLTGWQARKAMAQRYNISTRHGERYLSHARAKLLAESGKTEAEHKADAFAFYVAVLKNPSEMTAIKLKAQERVDKLFGLEGPQRVNISGSLGVADLRKELLDEAGYLTGQRERAIRRDSDPGHVGANGNGRAVENGSAPGGH